MTTEFTSWEDMTELEQAQCTFWDMYKDAYGVRPRGVDTSGWTLEQFQEEFVILGQAIDREETARKATETKAVEIFERRVAELLSIGAQDSAMAMRWIHEAEGTHGDNDFLAWTLGLPYQYFRKAA